MKKILLVLGMITSLAMATACGNTTVEEDAFEPTLTQEQVETTVEEFLISFNNVVMNNQQETVEKDVVLSAAVASFESALEDLGEYQSMEGCTFVENEDGVIINADIKGSKRTGTFELIFDDEYMLTSATTNVEYTMGEKMEKAGLNTLMGMGTVFSVLILIAWLISLFAFIPKIQAAFSKKEKKSEVAVEKAVAQIVENETVQEDDTELIAVIAAAIAAYEGSGSADNYVVRSIRRR